MLGSKEIRDFTPEKAVFGGYDARSVDMMLDQAADDMEALERENAELRAKLKVMVDKIEEYRRIESGIRQALMTAQGMADKTKKEASEQADQTRTQAQEDAEQLK
ncbi:MAG: DivIVA domain-containing protein, partial [Butyricicoccus sp.]|nr:DivIVA domain-containing protein [Butyricicoccus sp.]